MEKAKTLHEKLKDDPKPEEGIKAPHLEDSELDAVSGGVPGYWDYDDDSEMYPCGED